jgi:RHS repeat-associated protein
VISKLFILIGDVVSKLFSAVFVSMFLFQSVGFARDKTKSPFKMNLEINSSPRNLGKIGFTGERVGDDYEYNVSYSNVIVPDADFITYAPGSTITGSSAYTIVSDGCAGKRLPPTEQCLIRIRFKPTYEGSISYSLSTFYTFEWGGTTQTGAYTWYGGDDVLPPLTDNNPVPPPKQKCISGSIVRVDAQSLGERVPVVGTNFSISYSSEFAQSYSAVYNLSRKSFFNPNGWNIDILHYYDFEKQMLYKGSGTSEYSKLTGKYSLPAVVSSDGSELYVFNSAGKHVETRFGLTGSIKYSFAYDSSGLLTSITDSFGNVTTFTYAPTGDSYQITAPFGQVTTVSLNSSNLISSVSNPNSEIYSFTYKSGTDLLETFMRPGGQANTFLYSGTGRLTKDEGQGGNFWSLVEELNTTERKVTMSSKMGLATVYKSRVSGGDSIRHVTEPSGFTRESRSKYLRTGSLDSSPVEGVDTTTTSDDRVPTISRPASTIVTKNSIASTTSFNRTYTSLTSSLFTFGSMTNTQAVSGRITTSVYTTSNKTAVTTTPMGATATSIIDNYERPVSSRIGSDTPWTYTYDSAGRLTQVIQGTYNSVTNTYNTAGLIDTSTNARSETTSYTYDLAGRVTQVTRPDTKVIGFAYDANGNIIGVTPPSRLQHIFEFNAMELMSKYDPPALTGVTVKETLYSYNLDKQLTSIVRPDTQSAAFTYGSTTGLLNQITLARGNINYTYQTNTDLVSRADSADGIRSNFTYYGNDLKSEELRRSSDDFLYAMIQYGFDADHRKVTRGIRGNFPVFSTITTTLNDDNKPSQIGTMALTYTYPSGRLQNTTLDKISDARTYDALGNLESYTASYNPTSGSPTVLYSYTLTRDIASRIIGKSETIQGVTSTYVYSYDTVGRLTTVTKNGSAYSSYAYDDNGNRVSGAVNGVAFAATYDAQDRLSTYNSRTYAYNSNGDNIQIQWTPTTQSTFSYDALGTLLTATTPTGASLSYLTDSRGNTVRLANGGVTLSRYIYDDQNRIAGEYNDSGVMGRQFLYGTDAYSPDYAIDSTGYIRFIKDHLGSPRLMVKASDGTVMQRMDYDEFGRVIANTNPTYQPFGFAGGLYLRLPGLVKFGARYYDAEVGRWTTKDPIRFNGGDTNLYGYVASDPVNWIDPTGLKLWFADKYSEKALKSAIKTIMRSAAGRRLLKQLQGSSTTYKIEAKCGFDDAEQDGNTVRLDPNFHPDISTNIGTMSASTARVLAHELGHLAGGLDEGTENNMGNTNQYENPIMAPIEGYYRTSY